MKIKSQAIATLLAILSIVGIAALGIWIFTGGQNPFSIVAGEYKEYIPNFENPQTFEGSEGENFVFKYPEKFNINTLPIDGGGKRILVESTEPLKGFELTILPFDEKGPLRPQRIRQDLPNILIENERSTFVGVGEIPALAFYSEDEHIGKTFEIWFVHEGFLYEALTYPSFAETMEEILKTWRFK